MEYSVWFVCLLGIGIVFLGLVSIVILCLVVSLLCRKLTGEGESDAAPKTVAPAPAPVVAAPIADRSKKIAAVCAVIAEELGTDVSAIRVKSFRKI